MANCDFVIFSVGLPLPCARESEHEGPHYAGPIDEMPILSRAAQREAREGQEALTRVLERWRAP